MKTLIKNKKITEEVKEQFHDRAQRFEDSASWVKDRELLRLHNTLIPFNSRSKILDVCCGTGLVGKGFAGKACSVTGIDISAAMLKKAARRLDTCVNASAEAMPFADNHFDVVVCRQALHFLNLKKSINEMYRVCKANGRILVSQIVPYGNKDKAWLYKIHKMKQPLLKNFVDEKDMTRHLTAAGFVELEKHYFHIDENITDWLRYESTLSKRTIAEIKSLFRAAPVHYKKLHETRVINNDVIDKMKWVIFVGKKPA